MTCQLSHTKWCTKRDTRARSVNAKRDYKHASVGIYISWRGNDMPGYTEGYTKWCTEETLEHVWCRSTPSKTINICMSVGIHISWRGDDVPGYTEGYTKWHTKETLGHVGCRSTPSETGKNVCISRNIYPMKRKRRARLHRRSHKMMYRRGAWASETINTHASVGIYISWKGNDVPGFTEGYTKWCTRERCRARWVSVNTTRDWKNGCVSRNVYPVKRK
jgi:hypothetical protein